MAVSITGAAGGVPLPPFATNTPVQQGLGTSIIASATAASLTSGVGGTVAAPAPINAPTTIVTAPGAVLTGSLSVPTASIALDSQNAIFSTGLTANSTVVAADNSNSSIVNNNPLGNLIAATGAGGNVLTGGAGGNSFFTGVGGQDIVTLNGSSNALVSSGADNVSVGGPATITAAASGLDLISQTAASTLNFINGSRIGISSITGAAGGTVVVAGFGATSVTAGASGGPQNFLVDTSAGNVTLNGSLQTTDVFTFQRGSAIGTGNEVVSNFGAGSQINIRGYAAFNTAASGSGSVLLLSDGSQVTFTNVSVTQLNTTIKTI